MYAMSTLCQGCCYRAKHVRLCPKREIPLSMQAGMHSPNTTLSCCRMYLLVIAISPYYAEAGQNHIICLEVEVTCCLDVLAGS